MSDRPLILASTSPYRRELLERLHLPFTQERPDFDELPAGSMAPVELVRHNTLGKGRSVAARHRDARVIASDQLAVCNDLVLGKPGTAERAIEQLGMLSGQRVEFLTGLALLAAEEERFDIVPFTVQFRELEMQEIEAYVRTEQPLDCAGSFKSEGLGIALFESMHGDDPTALIGLPLIRLSEWLKPLRFL
ncbi:MAG TPA: Maf family protein [Mariprofundaceae bacterium]|nr:Maf family protein [Mariprofundaceae bacterium]